MEKHGVTKKQNEKKLARLTCWHLALPSALVTAWHLPNPHSTTTPISAGECWLPDRPVIQSEMRDLSTPGPDDSFSIHTDCYPMGVLTWLLRQILTQQPWLLCILRWLNVLFKGSLCKYLSIFISADTLLMLSCQRNYLCTSILVSAKDLEVSYCTKNSIIGRQENIYS